GRANRLEDGVQAAVHPVEQQCAEHLRGNIGPGDGQPQHHAEHQHHDREAPDAARQDAVKRAIEVESAVVTLARDDFVRHAGGFCVDALDVLVVVIADLLAERAGARQQVVYIRCLLAHACAASIAGTEPVRCRATRSASSPVRTACVMRSSPSSSRMATQRAFGRPGYSASRWRTRSLTARSNVSSVMRARRGLLTRSPEATSATICMRSFMP